MTDHEPATPLSPKVTAPAAAGALVTAALLFAALFGVDVDNVDSAEAATAVAAVLTVLTVAVGYFKRDPLRHR